MMTYEELEKSIAPIIPNLEEFCIKHKLSLKQFLSLRRMMYSAAERGAMAQEAYTHKITSEREYKNDGFPVNMETKNELATI